MDTAPIAIVGTGLSGYTVARELRRLDSSICVSMFTADEGHFYSKPMLSNSISARKTPEALQGQTIDRMREQLNAQIHAGVTVQAIMPQSREIVVNDQFVPYSKLVLAVGANPVRLALEGDAIDRIISVNSLNDYSVLHSQLSKPRRVVILGAGLIGCEFANDLVLGGHKVTLVDPSPWPLSRLLPALPGRLMEQALRDAGVDVRCEVSCLAVNADGRDTRVSLSDGDSLAADVVISAVGLKPDVALAQSTGLTVDRGIVVDRYLQTSTSDIFALGDCAQVDGMILPYVMPIMQCARALAATLAGKPTAVHYAAMPIVVKTPALPLAIAPPVLLDGQWRDENAGAGGLKLTYLDANGQATGFILGGKLLPEYRKLAATLPPWLAPQPLTD
jgi:rubredoxin-NAD+ reductase